MPLHFIRAPGILINIVVFSCSILGIVTLPRWQRFFAPTALGWMIVMGLGVWLNERAARAAGVPFRSVYYCRLRLRGENIRQIQGRYQQ